MNIRRPVPLWALLVAILVSASVATVIVYYPKPPGPDFNLTLGSNVLMQQGNVGRNSTIVKVESVKGFVGVVSFGVINPSGLDGFAQLSNPTGTDQSQVVLGSVGTLTLRTFAASAGDYTVRIVATGGQASHYADLVVHVEDLSIMENTTSITVPRGSSGTVAITLTSLNGLSGNITLQSGVCHPQSFGCPVDTYVSLSLAPSNLILQAGGTVTVILRVTVSSSDSPTTDQIAVSAHWNSWGFYPPGIQLTIV